MPKIAIVSRGDPIFGPCELMIPTHNKSCQPISSQFFFLVVPPNQFLVKPPVPRVISQAPKNRPPEGFQRENLHIPRILEAMELGQIDAAATTLVLRTSKYLGDDKTTRGLRKKQKPPRDSFFLGGREKPVFLCVFLDALKGGHFAMSKCTKIYIFWKISSSAPRCHAERNLPH